MANAGVDSSGRLEQLKVAAIESVAVPAASQPPRSESDHPKLKRSAPGEGTKSLKDWS